MQRLKGKEGRFRSNLSGKRVNFSARTVISPDPALSINEVGVPDGGGQGADRAGARHQGEPVDTEGHGQARGRTPQVEHYVPGVNYVIRPDGRRIKVTDKNAETVAETVEIGFIIERHLMDGDIVLFNRQPSLHRMSHDGPHGAGHAREDLPAEPVRLPALQRRFRWRRDEPARAAVARRPGPRRRS